MRFPILEFFVAAVDFKANKPFIWAKIFNTLTFMTVYDKLIEL